MRKKVSEFIQSTQAQRMLSSAEVLRHVTLRCAQRFCTVRSQTLADQCSTLTCCGTPFPLSCQYASGQARPQHTHTHTHTHQTHHTDRQTHTTHTSTQNTSMCTHQHTTHTHRQTDRHTHSHTPTQTHTHHTHTYTGTHTDRHIHAHATHTQTHTTHTHTHTRSLLLWATCVHVPIFQRLTLFVTLRWPVSVTLGVLRWVLHC